MLASPVVSSHDDSTITRLASKSVSKVAFNEINLSISENQCSSKITSNVSGKASVIVTKQCLSTAQASCSQENNKCDIRPGTDDTTKEVGQQIFIVKNFEATVQNDSLEERACEVLRPGNEDEIVVSCYGIALRRHDFWTLKELEWLNDQVNKPLY